MVAGYTVLIAALFTGLFLHILSLPSVVETTQYLYVEPGDGVLRVAYKAKKQGIVRRHWHLSLAASSLGYERSLKAGEYEILPKMPLKNTLHKIVKGQVFLRRVSIPEGTSSAELKLILENSFGLDTKDFSLPPEGTILPETYFYNRGESAMTLVHRMQRNLRDFLSKAWAERQSGLPIEDPGKAIILASIVEKETGVGNERALVAAVFVNRLRKGMRLQSDPTVIYGLTKGLPLGRGLTRNDLKGMTDYNTYRIAGLPKGPITNPGKDAILATLNPANVPYLYFVADGTGGHAFSITLDEHNNNVTRWRQMRAAQ